MRIIFSSRIVGWALAVLCLGLVPYAAHAQPASRAPEPTHADVAYGPHERNRMDVWLAPSDRPTPMVVFIHGGGFRRGDKTQIRGRPDVRMCLDQGVSFASLNYRFLDTAPIQEILRDAARAIQYLRSQSKAWNIDKEKIAAYGGSAGAGTSMWLAFHDDLADPESTDPVGRESTRLFAAGAMAGQASYDLRDWEGIVGPAPAGAARSVADQLAFYHFADRAAMESEEGDKVMRDCSMINLISKGDPPVILVSTLPDEPSRDRGHYVHHPRHATAIGDRCKQHDVEAVVVLTPDQADGAPQTAVVRFFLDKFADMSGR